MILWKLRGFARKHLPFEVRLRIALWFRAASDLRRGFRFATTRGATADFPHLVCAYERPFIDYPGQEHVAAAKRKNQAILASHLDGITIMPGEVFSVWQLAGRPTEREGYSPAAALKGGILTMEVGGAVCLLSTALYNAGLLGGLEIVERHCHSIDQYGENRYFELGRDAAIEYGYLDLRLRNLHAYPVQLGVTVEASRIVSSLRATRAPDFRVELDVHPAVVIEAGARFIQDTGLAPGARVQNSPGQPGLRITGTRRIIRGNETAVEALPVSLHHPVPAVIGIGSREAADLASMG